jgi:hypothetical protein
MQEKFWEKDTCKKKSGLCRNETSIVGMITVLHSKDRRRR